jgi:hypothetical protein
LQNINIIEGKIKNMNKILSLPLNIIKWLRMFLERNKIFFEIFSYVVIGFTGIIFSYFQWKTNEQQIEMHRNEIQPVFRIAFTLYKIDSEVYNTEALKIYNDGTPIKSFDYEIKTYYHLEYISKNNREEYYIPIIGFYWTELPKSNSVGILTECYLKNNNAEYARIYKECLSQSHEDEYYSIERFSLIKISYQDIIDEQHVVYYKNKELIGKDYHNEIIKKSEQLNDNFPIDVDKISLNLIRDKYIKK